MNRVSLLLACAPCAMLACASTFGLGEGATEADETGTTAGPDASTGSGGPEPTTTSASTGDVPLAPPILQLGFSRTKQFVFTWSAVAGAEYYQLFERADPGGEYQQLGGDLVGESIALTMPLHLRFGAGYLLRACDGQSCVDSAPVDVVDSLAGAVGYVKPDNTGEGDAFATSVALSADGRTLAVGAPLEDSLAGPDDDAGAAAGAVYVFVQTGGAWSQAAYVKAPAPDPGDMFGRSVALSADGLTLAVGAPGEDSNASGVGGKQEDDSEEDTGAVYVYARAGDAWTHEAYVKSIDSHKKDRFGEAVALSADGDTLAVAAALDTGAGAVFVYARGGAWSYAATVKASNTEGAEGDDPGDDFGGARGGGRALALSADGATLVVGAPGEDSAADQIDGDPLDDTAREAGAAYVFTRDGGAWTQQAYLKATNAQADDRFGTSVALASDGDTLAIGAPREGHTGATYVFTRSGGAWTQRAYLKVLPTDESDGFGSTLALADGGAVLAVGAREEDGSTLGIGGAQADNSAPQSGAVYAFVRSGDAWTLRAYVKASNTKGDDDFGGALALSAAGDVLAVGAPGEASGAAGVDGDQTDIGAPAAGAVYLY